MLSRKHTELLATMERLEGGLEKLKSTAAQVDDLKEKLAAQEVRTRVHILGVPCIQTGVSPMAFGYEGVHCSVSHSGFL